MEKQFKGQTALITGATQGIGYELAKCCANDGYNLILVARHSDELERVAQEIASEYGVEAQIRAADLMEITEAFALYDDLKKENINVDVLINNAGQGVYGAFTGTDIYRELDIIQLNICALVILTKLFLSDMVARDSGKILQLASVASKAPSPYQAVYGGTKAFIYMFTEGLISELENSKVTMTALLPGPTDTDFFNKAGAENTKLVVEGELADPADVARDGYDAMQQGESKVTSGMKNKMQLGFGNFMTDEALASQVKKQHELSDEAIDIEIENPQDVHD
jgi:short-subunit dehydrogenase